MEADEDDKCPVCLDFFDDPVLCTDQHAYCRRCAGLWSAGEASWKSCRTNLEIPAPCVLGPDFPRHARACALKARAALTAASTIEQVHLAATARSGATPCVSSAQAAATLARALEDGDALRGCHPTALLELASRCDRLGSLPAAVVLGALRVDRAASTAPLLQLSVLRRLRAAQTARFLVAAVDRHLCFRSSTRDAVEVLESRSDVHGFFVRSASAPVGWAIFRDEAGGLLRVAALPAHFYGPYEAREGAVAERPSDGLKRVFTTQERLPLQEGRFWAVRRGGPAFPDHDGSDLAEEPCGPVPPCATVFEEELSFLPCGLRYEPSADFPSRRPRSVAAGPYTRESERA